MAEQNNTTLSVGQKIKELRNKVNMSQQQLAQELSISRDTLSKYENDKALPTEDIMNKLAEIFNVPIEYFTEHMIVADEDIETDKDELDKTVDNKNENSEAINKTIIVENDKVYVSAGIKLGLKNYSTINIDFGITKVIGKDDNIENIANQIFEETILPKTKQFASKLAAVGYQMANIIESKNNARRTFTESTTHHL